MVRPLLPFWVRLNISGELVLRFLVFHLPASPGPPETRWKVIESLEVPPSALRRLASRVSILPSSESFSVEAEVTLPLVFSVLSHVLASTAFQATLLPHLPMLSLPSVFNL